MAFTLHHKKYKTEENTKKSHVQKNDSETKPKQNKTKQNLKKEKKKLLSAIQNNSFQHNLQKKNGDHTWSLFQEQDFLLTW